MIKKHNSKLTDHSRDLRKNMTAEERHLWYDFLSSLPYTVKRQKIVGCYILDFFITEKNIAVELDGSQHFSAEGKAYDSRRDIFLNDLGITVLRYKNSLIRDHFRAVCNDILRHLKD